MGFLRQAAVAAGLLLAVIGPARAQPEPEPDLVIRFLDVGQGDAALITMGRRAVLVDAGRGSGIRLWFEELGIDSLVAVIASHNHDDHIGGMPAIVSDLAVDRYLANGRPPDNILAREVDGWLTTRQIRRPAPPWDPIVLGDARITVFPSPLAGASENNSSLGVLIERGGFRALLTGDSEKEELNAWLAAGIIPKVAILKAAHHGAGNGVTPGWILRTDPAVVIISVGANNSYGHPDPIAVRYYQTHGRRVLRTDQAGTVTVKVDPAGRYQIDTSGPEPR